ncbi:MAG: carbohydrate porin [Chthoniobacterales bacterium]|nr:carbohydrate porin [Chthoniobacterales bacterium]
MKNKNTPTMRRVTTRIFFALIFAICAGVVPQAQAADTKKYEPLTLEEWWNGKKFTGNWFGARDAIADHGLSFEGKWRGAYYGVVASQNGQRGFFDEELLFGAKADFKKMLGVDALEGLTGFGEVRWREPGYDSNPNNYVQASSMFNPSHFQSGTGWRLLTFGLKYVTPELFGAKEFLTITGGWVRPQKEFIDQPISKIFVNNAIESAKGIGGNIPFSSSFSSWGGTVQIKPVEWQYTKLGLFMAYPESTFSSNNGLMFEGYAPDPSQNSLFFMGETGITPKIGASKLPGRYAFGSYYYGEDNRVYGQPKYGFYWQADQMLYRESSAPAAEGKKAELSKEGLSMFSLVTCAPKYNGQYPFYFQTGLAYEGLIPTRNKDTTYIGMALGDYDDYTRVTRRTPARNRQQKTYTAVIEGGYKAQLNGWAFIQPYFQYISQPNGNTYIANAAILGFMAGVDF